MGYDLSIVSATLEPHAPPARPGRQHHLPRPFTPSSGRPPGARVAGADATSIGVDYASSSPRSVFVAVSSYGALTGPSSHPRSSPRLRQALAVAIQPEPERIRPLQAGQHILLVRRLREIVGIDHILRYSIREDHRKCQRQRVRQQARLSLRGRRLRPVRTQIAPRPQNIHPIVNQRRRHSWLVIPAHPREVQQAVRQLVNPPAPVRRVEVVDRDDTARTKRQIMCLIIPVEMQFWRARRLLQRFYRRRQALLAGLRDPLQRARHRWRQRLIPRPLANERDIRLRYGRRRSLLRPCVSLPLKSHRRLMQQRQRRRRLLQPLVARQAIRRIRLPICPSLQLIDSLRNDNVRMPLWAL